MGSLAKVPLVEAQPRAVYLLTRPCTLVSAGPHPPPPPLLPLKFQGRPAGLNTASLVCSSTAGSTLAWNAFGTCSFLLPSLHALAQGRRRRQSRISCSHAAPPPAPAASGARAPALPWLPVGSFRGMSTDTLVPRTGLISRNSRTLHARSSRKRFSVEASWDLAAVVSSVGNAVWGKGLPPGLLVQVARETWTAGWKVMMSQLAPTDASGAYRRPASSFRELIGPDHPTFVPESGRYVLYAALSCPWAHRTIVVHRLRGLGEAVPLCILQPGESGLWQFAHSAAAAHPGAGAPSRSLSAVAAAAEEKEVAEVEVEERLVPTFDLVNGCGTLKEVYQLQEGGYNGRSTVPMLWDTKTRRVVNNESADIIRILNSQFNDWATNKDLDLAPPGAEEGMRAWDQEIYANVNNGVYCCGFASSQEAYDEAVERLFGSLDRIDAHLSSSRFLCGDCFTLSDVRLFTTLVRFDVAYHTIFKCMRRKISEYPSLYGYLREIFQMPGVAGTCDVSGVGRSYFGSLFPLNPGGIIPTPPLTALSSALLAPHGRTSVTARTAASPATA